MSSRVRVNEVSAAAYSDALLDSLTVEQLRKLLARIWTSTEEIPAAKARQDVLSLISASATSEKVVEAALEIEASSPMKHCFAAQCGSEGVDRFSKVPQNSTLGFAGIEARVAFVSDSAASLVVTLEHFIRAREWRQVDDRTKVIEERLVRHPLVLDIRKRSGNFFARYPGFSSGSASSVKDRFSYETIISGLIFGLRENFSISVRSLAIGDAVKTLQKVESSRISVVGADVEGEFGRMSLAASSDVNSIHKVLEELLGENARLRKSEMELLVDGILSKSSNNALVLFWTLERIFTRIKFWESGAEILFVWNGQDQTFQMADDVVGLLCDLSSRAKIGSSRDAWNVIAQTAEHGVLTPRILSERSSSDPEESKKVLLDAARAALVEPVFRLRDVQLLDTLADRWTNDLKSLFVDHELPNGQLIDGRDPRNIEVGFRRIGRGSSE